MILEPFKTAAEKLLLKFKSDMGILDEVEILKLWSMEEWDKGNRVKASKINKVFEKMWRMKE